MQQEENTNPEVTETTPQDENPAGDADTPPTEDEKPVPEETPTPENDAPVTEDHSPPENETPAPENETPAPENDTPAPENDTPPDETENPESETKNPTPESTDENSLQSEYLPFRFARFLSWASFVLIVASSMCLAIFLGDSARTTLINRQQDFNRTLGENLSRQIIHRFIWPTARLTGGLVNLTDPVQYARLHNIVNESRYGLNLLRLRIYGGDRVVNYSLDRTELGRADFLHPIIEKSMETGQPYFERESEIPWFQAMFLSELPSGSFTLRMAFPLTLVWTAADRRPNQKTIGTLELIQDITEDYEVAVRLQWIIFGICGVSSAILFILLQLFIKRAETVLAERMRINRSMLVQIHENERLASMGRVVASIAHEIRNPLGIIRSSSELLLNLNNRAGSEALQKKILTAIHSESCRLSQIVTDFLDYARPGEVRGERLDITVVIEQVLNFLEGELNRNNIAVIKSFYPPVYVTGDRDLLYRALYNIFSNSVQAMENAGGSLAVGLKTLPDQRVEITVSDTGPGFPEGQIDEVSEPFFTTKAHGTGLGMAIVSTIIKGHHGTMTLSNAPEGGAVTKIILPAGATEPEPTTESQPQPQSEENNDEHE